ILVDGELRGTTPATLDIMQGQRQLVLRKPGFTDHEQMLAVVAGQAIDAGAPELVPAAGQLLLSSTPGGANVTLDGEFQGQTPLTLSLAPDRAQRLMVSLPGYRRHSETVQLSAGTSAEKAVALAAELGEVDLRVSPAEAEVRINGRLVGSGSQALSLPAHEHRVKISLAGYKTVSQRLTPRPGLEQRVTINLQTEQEAKLANLQSQIITPVGQTLRLFIPGESGPASFTMGSSRREPGRRANEVLRPVTLSRLFYLQTTEVTNAQFRQFLSSHNSGQAQTSSLNREHQPVAQVSWQQAARFCNWLSEREGLPPFYQQQQGIVTGFNPEATGYRLPTEAEWSWAARTRGEQLLTFPWGDTFPPTTVVENYADTSSAYITGRTLSDYNDGQAVSATVATFPANHYGLHDLGGNVAEWVHDVYRIAPANSSPETDPTGPGTGDNYVIRGSSWAMSRRSELRLPYRDYGQAGRDDVGFRVARYAE
ncbi:MAG TPA: SUMF1/EgtB/PvdO family nonheme iron enzyme, partial [Kineobactrum sp.]